MQRFDNKQGDLYRREKMKVKRGAGSNMGRISQHVRSQKFQDEDVNEDEMEVVTSEFRSKSSGDGGQKKTSVGAKKPTRIVFSD